MSIHAGPPPLPRKTKNPACGGNPDRPHLTSHRWREAGENRYGDMVWKCSDCGTVDDD